MNVSVTVAGTFFKNAAFSKKVSDIFCCKVTEAADATFLVKIVYDSSVKGWAC